MSDDPPKAIITLRGTEEYARYVDRLLAEVRAEGQTVQGRAGLAELALNLLGERRRLYAPTRIRPLGSNQYDPKS
jgi:hypothetical protein